MTNPQKRSAKAILRTEAREAMAKLSLEARSTESKLVTEALTAWLTARPALRRVATFASLPDEPDLAALPRSCGQLAWNYPRLGENGELTFHRVADPSTLQTGSFGIREPDPRQHEEIAITDLDAIFCPGLAFSADGTRLGRGKGHYDRALARAPANCLRIGVTFGAIIFPSLPRETHDIAMTHLAGASGVDAVG